jgi:hypothetical protein
VEPAVIEREVLVRELEALPGGSRLVRPAGPAHADGRYRIAGFSTATGHADEADAMVLHLVSACPVSDAEALRVLRAAFPSTPLHRRVEACARWKSAA